MGQDKALLPWDLETRAGQGTGAGTLAGHLAAMISQAAGSVTLVGEPARYQHLGFTAWPDLRPGEGPLAGIEAALAGTRAQWNLTLACDLPGVNLELLAQLFEHAERGGAECTVARDAAGRVHPLCAVYDAGCLATVQAALDRGERRLLRVLEELRVSYLDVADTIANVNTPEEWRAATCR